MATVSKVLRKVQGQEYELNGVRANFQEIFVADDNLFQDRAAVDVYLVEHRRDFGDGNDRFLAYWKSGKKLVARAYPYGGRVDVLDYPFEDDYRWSPAYDFRFVLA